MQYNVVEYSAILYNATQIALRCVALCCAVLYCMETQLLGPMGRLENGLADVKLNGLQGFQLDLFYMRRYHVHYHYVTAIVILLLRGLLSMNML